jgi:hypothetical protein
VAGRSTPHAIHPGFVQRLLPLLVLGPALVAGCGGGVPLLYPARALPRGEVRATGGVTTNIPLGSLTNDLNAARSEAAATNGPGAPGADSTYAKGALVSAAVTPGFSPVVAARVGIGWRAEGGITYTGRAARIDVRRSFDWGAESLSIGLGMTAAFYGTDTGGQLPQVDLGSLHGYGADVPVLFGWESTGGFYMLWAGVRGGWEHDAISTLTSEPFPSVPGDAIELSANRFYGGALVGIAAGFRHIHVALELDAAYQTITGWYDANHATVSGFSAAPAGALWFTF